MNIANAHITRTIERFPHHASFEVAYAQREYLNAWIDETNGVVESACVTFDNKCEWIMTLRNDNINVRIVKGDIERIRDLVTREIETYDTTLIWQ